MNTNKITLCTILLLLLQTSCGETLREEERNLDLLRTKALALHSIINVEPHRLKVLDSAIADEFSTAGKLDSVVMHESIKIDSLVRWLYRKVDQ